MSSSREVGGPRVVRWRPETRLRIAREQTYGRLEAAAHHSECSTSKSNHMEHGQGIPKTLELIALLCLHWLDNAKKREEFLWWTKEVKAAAWWQPFSNAMSGDLGLYSRSRHGLRQAQAQMSGLVGTSEQPSVLSKAVKLLIREGIDETHLIEQYRVSPELFRITTARLFRITTARIPEDDPLGPSAPSTSEQRAVSRVISLLKRQSRSDLTSAGSAVNTRSTFEGRGAQ